MDATLFSRRLVGLQMLAGFGRYPVEEENQNGCSSVKKESNLRFKGTDWHMCARRRISTSGEGNSIRWFWPAPPIGSYIPQEWKAVRSSRLTDNRLLSTLALPAMQTFSSWMLREAHLVGSPASHRAKLCQPGRETHGGSTLRRIALAIMKYGRCLRRAEPLRKSHIMVDSQPSNRPMADF